MTEQVRNAIRGVAIWMAFGTLAVAGVACIYYANIDASAAADTTSLRLELRGYFLIAMSLLFLFAGKILQALYAINKGERSVKTTPGP
jgi:TRAP-type C4-dicarboxylate transport system permease small subunit